MNKMEILKEKIELLRGELDQMIASNGSREEVYEKSIALDKVLEEYYELEEHN